MRTFQKMLLDISNTSINKALKPSGTVDKWGQDVKDLDFNIKKEIDENIPKASSSNQIESALGSIWDLYGDVTLGLVPTDKNRGGLLANTPGYFGISDSLYGIRGDKNSDKLYINGMLNLEEDALQGGRNLIGEDSFRYAYNPSRGLIPDLIETMIDKWGSAIGMQTGASRQTEEYLRTEKNLTVYMHSQGHEIAKQGALNSKDNGHTYKSYGAPMSNKEISKVFGIEDIRKNIEKNPGDYVSNPLNIFNPKTWNEPGHGTENYGASRKAKEQGDK